MTHRHGRAFVPAIHGLSEALHRDVDARSPRMARAIP
jgi:hypothetical protein